MELLPYYSKGDLNEIIKNTRKAFMEEIFEELDILSSGESENPQI